MSIHNSNLNPISATILGAFGGAVGGAIYAVFARLPIERAAQAYGICGAVSAAFSELAVVFASLFTKRTSTLLFVQAIARATLSALTIKFLREMKLMGNKMLVVSVIGNVFALAIYSTSAICSRKNGN